MQSKRSSNCSSSCNCRDEIIEARTFVSNLEKNNKLSQKQRDSYSVVYFDLKGSTKLIRTDPIRGITRMLLHNKMCRNIVEKNNGEVIKELGDAIMVIFKNPGSACQCAIKVIRNLRKHGRGICTKVTVGSGTMWKIRTANEDDIYGVPVNLCTRMSAHAKEDQILFEENSYGQVRDWLSKEKKIRFVKVKSDEQDDLKLRDFGPVPMRKILVY